jgi:protein involved in temperature-dependent protein secretion
VSYYPQVSDPIQEMMAGGDFDGVAVRLEQTLAAGYDPGLGIQLFGVHIWRADPDRAEAVLREVMRQTPQIQPHDLLANLSAARAYLRRRGDPTLAGQRNLVLGQPRTVPDPWLAELIKASVEHASGQHELAARSVASAHAATPPASGVLINRGAERRFSRLVDSDDLTGATLPCFSGPHLCDVPFAEISRIDFAGCNASWDWIWMPATIALRDGRVFDVRIPSRYPGTAGHPDATVRLNRMTLWDRDHGYAVAVGMVDYNADGAVIGIENISSIRFD